MSDDFPFLHRWDRSRYPLGMLHLCLDEDKIEKTILEALKWKGILAVKIDTGAKAIRGRAVGLAKRLGGTSAQIAIMNAGRTSAGMNGLPDIVGVLPGGRALWIEVKAPEWVEKSAKTGRIIQKRAAGSPAPEQLDFLDRMHRQGAVVGVAWSPGDLDEILGKV